MQCLRPAAGIRNASEKTERTKRTVSLLERTVLYAPRQIELDRWDERENGRSPSPKICIPLAVQSVRSVEAPDQRERAAGPAARLLRGQDGLHAWPACCRPDLAVRPRRYLVPAAECRFSRLRLRPDQPPRPRLRAPTVLLPQSLEERLAHPRFRQPSAWPEPPVVDRQAQRAPRPPQPDGH